MNRIPDFTADCVGDTNSRFALVSYEYHSKWPATPTTRWGRKFRKLPSGNHPTRHGRIRPSVGDGPCHGGPSKLRDRRGCACAHGNRAFWRACADLAGMYASLRPLFKLFFRATRYPLGVAAAPSENHPTANQNRFELPRCHGVWFVSLLCPGNDFRVVSPCG